MGCHNDSEQDTTPGASSLLAPPDDFRGDGQGYARWFSQRMKACPAFRQRVGLLARRPPGSTVYTGTYKEAGAQAVGRIRASMTATKTQKKGNR